MSPEAVEYVYFHSSSKRKLFSYEYGFISAEDKRMFTRALDYYGISYDYETLIADLPF